MKRTDTGDTYESLSDVVSLRSELDGTWVGVGHSSGAAAIAMAQIDAPGAFEALLLIEPIVLPPPHERVEDHELVRMTLRRRFAFGDREAAIANFSQKQPFASWDPRVLDAYVDGGLRSDGNRLLLKCDPTVEAEFYRMGSQHDTWDRLGAIDVPVALLAGGASNTHSAEFMALLAERFRDVTVTVVDGATGKTDPPCRWQTAEKMRSLWSTSPPVKSPQRLAR